MMKARVKVAFFDGKLHKVGEIVDVKKPSNLVEVIEDSVTKTEVKKTVVKVEEETDKIREWMYANCDKRVDFDIVSKAYDDATPDMVVDTLIDILNKGGRN